MYIDQDVPPSMRTTNSCSRECLLFGRCAALLLVWNIFVRIPQLSVADGFIRDCQNGVIRCLGPWETWFASFTTSFG